jgi:hypothetical protein
MGVSATRTSSSVAEREVSAAGPAGLGMAIVFLWGLAVQYSAQGIGGTASRFGLHHGAGRMLSYLAAALMLAALGEGLRRGGEWARLGTIALAVLVIALGVSNGLVFIAGHGMPRRLVLTTVTEVTLIPWIAWRLSLRRTGSWFAASPGGVIGAALAGGVLYAAIVIDRVAASGLRLSLPSGKPMALAASVALELAAVPLVAALLWLPSTSKAPPRPGLTERARVGGVWLAALVAWAVPWGIAVAITQSLGVKVK